MVEKIQDGVVVTMSYLMTVDGKEVENATADDPMFYLHGADTILPQLAEALTGKAVGDKLTVDVLMEPEIWEAPREDFDGLPEDLAVGDEIDIYDADGDAVRALVKSIDDEKIVLDMMDIEEWMAGKTATFKVEVLALREANEDELAIGEPEEYFDFLNMEDDHDHDHDH